MHFTTKLRIISGHSCFFLAIFLKDPCLPHNFCPKCILIALGGYILLRFLRHKQSMVGLDIQPEGISLVCGRWRRRYFQMEYEGRVMLPEGVITEGRVQEKERVIAAISSLVNQAGVQGHFAIVALPTDCTINQEIVLPQLPCDEAYEAEIDIRIRHYLPEISTAVYWDYQMRADRQSAYLFAITQDIANQYIDVVSQAGLIIKIIEPDWHAILRMFQHLPVDLLFYLQQRLPCSLVSMGLMLRKYA